MFSPDLAPDLPRTSAFASPAAPTSWRGALRHAADLTLAFTTLESYSVEDVWPPRRRAVPEAAPTAPGADAAAAAVPQQERRRIDPQTPQPSRRRPPAPSRRRPGATRAPVQPCVTPVATAPGGARRIPAGTHQAAVGTRLASGGTAGATRSVPVTAGATRSVPATAAAIRSVPATAGATRSVPVAAAAIRSVPLTAAARRATARQPANPRPRAPLA